MAGRELLGITTISTEIGITGQFVRASFKKVVGKGATLLDSYFLDLGLRTGDRIDFGGPDKPEEFITTISKENHGGATPRTATTPESVALMVGVNAVRGGRPMTSLESRAIDLLEQRLKYSLTRSRGEVHERYVRQLELLRG